MDIGSWHKLNAHFWNLSLFTESDKKGKNSNMKMYTKEEIVCIENSTVLNTILRCPDAKNKGKLSLLA